jgi:hypothetical protein
MPALGKYDKRPGVKKKIDDIPQWQKVFEEVMAEDIAADKKPVRWILNQIQSNILEKLK